MHPLLACGFDCLMLLVACADWICLLLVDERRNDWLPRLTARRWWTTKLTRMCTDWMGSPVASCHRRAGVDSGSTLGFDPLLLLVFSNHQELGNNLPSKRRDTNDKPRRMKKHNHHSHSITRYPKRHGHQNVSIPTLIIDQQRAYFLHRLCGFPAKLSVAPAAAALRSYWVQDGS